jgi:hypothetical protein
LIEQHFRQLAAGNFHQSTISAMTANPSETSSYLLELS